MSGDLRVIAVAAVLAEFPMVTEADLFGPGQKICVVAARRLLYALLREPMRMSWLEVAEACGLPCHSTCMTAYQRLRQLWDRPIVVQRSPERYYSALTWGEHYEDCLLRMQMLMQGWGGDQFEEFFRDVRDYRDFREEAA